MFISQSSLAFRAGVSTAQERHSWSDQRDILSQLLRSPGSSANICNRVLIRPDHILSSAIVVQLHLWDRPSYSSVSTFISKSGRLGFVAASWHQVEIWWHQLSSASIMVCSIWAATSGDRYRCRPKGQQRYWRWILQSHPRITFKRPTQTIFSTSATSTTRRSSRPSSSSSVRLFN